MAEDFRVSVSKTKTFNQCKKQYQFNYLLKFPKKEREYHTFGKFCHKVLEVFHQRYQEGCLLPYNKVMGEAWKEAWAEFKEKMTPEMKKECWDLINRYLKMVSTTAAVDNNGMPANVIGVEKRFEIPVGENIILNGAIDRIQLDADDIVHVADYKTTKNKKYLKNDWFQLLAYAYVICKEDPTLDKVRASYILLRHDFEYITTEFSRQQIKEVENKVIDYVSQMRTETIFEASPSNLCGWCDYLEYCDQGKAKVAGSSFTNKNIYGEVGYGN